MVYYIAELLFLKIIIIYYNGVSIQFIILFNQKGDGIMSKQKINWDDIALVPNEMVYEKETEKNLPPYKLYLVDRSLIASGGLDMMSNAIVLEITVIYDNHHFIVNNHHGIKTIVLTYRKDVCITKSDIDYLITELSSSSDNKHRCKPVELDKYFVNINWKEVKKETVL